MIIKLEQLNLWGFHGLYDTENSIGQWFELNISIEINDPPVNITDDSLNHSIDYTAVLNIVEDHFKVPCKTLEFLASTLINRIKTQLQECIFISVEIKKPQPPVSQNLKFFSILLERRF